MADMVAQTSETLGGASGGDGDGGGLMSRVLSKTAEASEAQTVARVSHESHVLGSGFEGSEFISARILQSYIVYLAIA